MDVYRYYPRQQSEDELGGTITLLCRPEFPSRGQLAVVGACVCAGRPDGLVCMCLQAAIVRRYNSG